MRLAEILEAERQIWGADKLTREQIAVRLGVVLGDICRETRAADKDRFLKDEDLKKELGNLIASTVRFIDDLGFDPAECVALALAAQEKFAAGNLKR